MIFGYLIGDKALVARITSLFPAAKADMDRTVDALGLGLQAIVQRDYLTGQVLKVQTGRLRTSITRGQPDSRSRFESTDTTSFSYVGTNVWYGVAWENSGFPAYDIVPTKAKTLRFEIDGQILFRKRVHHPAQGARPYLKPALHSFTAFAREQMLTSLQRTAERVL